MSHARGTTYDAERASPGEATQTFQTMSGNAALHPETSADGGVPTHSSEPATSQHADRNVAGDLRNEVAAQLTAGKHRLGDALAGVGGALRKAGDELKGDNAMVADYVAQAGHRLAQVADSVRTRGVGELTDEVARFGRKQPLIFVGGAFLLGAALARFIKSSAGGASHSSIVDRRRVLAEEIDERHSETLADSGGGF